MDKKEPKFSVSTKFSSPVTPDSFEEATETSIQSQQREKQPKLVLADNTESRSHTIFAFPPNRDTLGSTAYFIVEEDTILVDCPAWNEANQAFLHRHGGVRSLVLTHRGAIAHVREIQEAFGCDVVIQEQEAYLLPEVKVTTFERSLTLSAHSRAIWTPGHSPGSSCLYYNGFGGVLFSGRHLLPTPQGNLMPFRTAKTFHWHRQLQSVQRLLDEFTPETLQSICPGANIGFLRGKSVVESGYEQLQGCLLEVVKDSG